MAREGGGPIFPLRKGRQVVFGPPRPPFWFPVGRWGPPWRPEAAWPVRDTYHSFGNANSDVVVVLSQGGPLPGLVQEVEVLKELSPLNLERLHLLNPHQAQTIDPAAFMAADITFDEAKAADVESAAMLATLVDHFIG